MVRKNLLIKCVPKRSWRLYPIVVIFAVFTTYITYKELQDASTQMHQRDINKMGAWKRIVWFELWHGGLRMNANAVNMDLCEYKQCNINFIDNNQQRKDYFHSADAVIFQGGRLPRVPPKRAHKKQIYVFSTVESPIHLRISNGGKAWNSEINWTMTYRQDSDILYQYGSVKPKKIVLTDETNYAQIFKEKTKEVAWLVSDCLTESSREKYVKHLQRYVKVDVYGRCGPFKNCTKDEGVKCLEKIAKDYKFYLSFENSICKDYITEKVFVWFTRHTITVVRGARNYSDLLPPHTYIDTHKFDSIEKLGTFLKKLGNNEKEYVKYLEEKDRYETEMLRSQFQKAYCDLCKRLHNIDNYTNVYQNITQWWFENACQRKISDIS